MAETTATADDVRAGLKKARGANFVLDEKTAAFALFYRKRWEDVYRGVSFEFHPAIPLPFHTPDGLVRKSVMEGTVQFDARTKVNVCVSAWQTEVVKFGPWDRSSDLGTLEGHVFNICIERINHDNIARPQIAGLSNREYQEIAFLIEPPLRGLLDQFAASERIAKVPEGPLHVQMRKDCMRIVNNVAARLERGEISRSHLFVPFARRAAYEAGLGVDELSKRLELLSMWQQPTAELVAYHAASVNAVCSFDPLKIAKLPFDRYFTLPDKDVRGKLLGVDGEPDVRIIQPPLDRDDPDTSRIIVELGGRPIDFTIRNVGFGSLAAYRNAATVPDKDWLPVYMISDPCSTVFPRKRLGEDVTPEMVARALRHLHVVVLSPQFGRWSSSRQQQVFSI